MKVNFRNLNLEKYGVKKFQEGGEMAAPEEAPAAPAPELGAEDPMQQILQAAAQAVQTQDAQLALQVCAALVEMAQGGAPQQAAPGEPVYKKGGRLVRFINK